LAWSGGESDVIGGERARPLAGVYEILASELPPPEDRG
jgi:hypothetical protein